MNKITKILQILFLSSEFVKFYISETFPRGLGHTFVSQYKMSLTFVKVSVSYLFSTFQIITRL